MDDEKKPIMLKIEDIVTFPEKEHESDEAIADEFYKFVQTMLDASAASNGTVLYVNINRCAGVYVYEKILNKLPRQSKHNDLNYKFVNILEIFSYKYLNETTNDAYRYENLNYPFIMGHEEIVVSATLIRDEVYKGAYGIKFIKNKTTNKYDAKLFFNTKDKISLFEKS